MSQRKWAVYKEDFHFRKKHVGTVEEQKQINIGFWAQKFGFQVAFNARILKIHKETASSRAVSAKT